jgi:hypothetical protein
MKATLEFNLPDDQTEFNFANSGSRYYCALWEMDQWLRSKIKYGENLTDEQYGVYELCREELRDIMSNNTISFND